MKIISAHVECTVQWGRVSNVVRAGVPMCYYPAAPPFHVIAVLSGTRVVRVLCVVMAAPYYVVAFVCVGIAAKCARLRLTAPGSSTQRFLLLSMPKRGDCAKSKSASIDAFNRR